MRKLKKKKKKKKGKTQKAHKISILVFFFFFFFFWYYFFSSTRSFFTVSLRRCCVCIYIYIYIYMKLKKTKKRFNKQSVHCFFQFQLYFFYLNSFVNKFHVDPNLVQVIELLHHKQIYRLRYTNYHH